ncbi:MAG: DUF1385 domain-containing protein [Acidimicrobiia bacterium]
MSRPPGATVGGQAVIEGVMMRGPDAWAVAVRRQDGIVESVTHELPRLSARSRLAKVPFVRGALVLWESLSLGMQALTWSAQRADAGDEKEMSKGQLVFSMTVALVFFLAVFMVVPLLVAGVFDDRLGDSSIVFNVIDGAVRVLLFIGYIWLIGRSKEIRRVFEYHGAEHMTIHAYEAGDPLDQVEIGKYSPRHPRCGTNFLMIVVLLALVVFTFVGRPSLPWLIASRVLLVPVVAAVSYELLKAAADRRWLQWASRPGMWLQSLTTRPPDPDQVEVAVASLLAALSDPDVREVAARGPMAYSSPAARVEVPDDDGAPLPGNG